MIIRCDDDIKKIWYGHLRLNKRRSFLTLESLLLRLGRRECFFLGRTVLVFFGLIALALFIFFFFMIYSP